MRLLHLRTRDNEYLVLIKASRRAGSRGFVVSRSFDGFRFSR
jgi:hypothetical protein